MSKKKIEEAADKKILVKNYIILSAIFLVSIVIVLYLCNVYKVYENIKLEEPVIRGSLVEISSADLGHYVVDTPSVIVYACAPKDDRCRKFERKLKKYVEKEQIVDEIIYLNIGDEDLGEFTNKFNEDYKFKTKLKNNYPAFITFSDGKIDAILQSGKGNDLSISKVENFVELYKSEYDEEEMESNVEE